MRYMPFYVYTMEKDCVNISFPVATWLNQKIEIYCQKSLTVESKYLVCINKLGALNVLQSFSGVTISVVFPHRYYWIEKGFHLLTIKTHSPNPLWHYGPEGLCRSFYLSKLNTTHPVKWASGVVLPLLAQPILSSFNFYRLNSIKTVY